MEKPSTNSKAVALSIPESERDEHRAVLWSILAFWIVHLAVLAVLSLLVSSDPVGVIFRRFLLVFVAAMLCYAIHRALRPLRWRPFWQIAILASLFALIGSAVYGAITTAILYYGIGYPGMPYFGPLRPYTINMFVEDAFLWLYSFFSWTALYLALIYHFDARDRERRLARMEAFAHKAQVRALRYQINPHFLFNTLNSISSMMWEKELDRAEGMLVSLSSFLRTTLEIDPSEDVTLAQEIALQQLYLEIEQIRFPERLKVEIDIPPELEGARVPSLILQPLVENAIKYAVAPSKGATRLRIVAHRLEDSLMLQVEDDGDGPDVAGGTGVGLLNVRQRLATRFGERWSLNAGPGRTEGYRVVLGMPLQYAP
jgi:two-component system LytT family sensor kinase